MIRKVFSLLPKYHFALAKQSIIPVDIELEIRRSEKLEQLQILHDSLQAKIDKETNFPYKIYGTTDTYQENFSYMAFRMMQYYGVDPKILAEYFIKIFKGTLHSLKNNNEEFMNEYLEPNFKEKLLASMASLKAKKLTLQIEENQTITNGQVLVDQAEILQNAMIRGLSVNRELNQPAQQYIKYSDDQESVFTIFTPKYITQPQKFINPTTNKTIYDDYSKLMIMRSFVRIKSPTTLIIPELETDRNLFTHEHLCIFENEMVPPKIFKSGYKLEGYMEWLMKWRFGCWRLVDIDNAMLGNPLLKNSLRKDWNEEIFRGSKYDTERNTSVRDPER